MYVVGLNGPPRCGKDSVGRMLAEHLDKVATIPVREESLSMPLRWIAFAMVGRTYHESEYEDFKVEFFPSFGKTGRDLMIDVSERFMKKVYSQRVMADLLIERNKDFDGLLIIRDMGFQCEVTPLIEAYGSYRVYVARIKRPPFTFNGDSREWVNHLESRFQMDIPNDEGLDELHTESVRLYGRLVNQMGWKL